MIRKNRIKKSMNGMDFPAIFLSRKNNKTGFFGAKTYSLEKRW